MESRQVKIVTLDFRQGNIPYFGWKFIGPLQHSPNIPDWKLVWKLDFEKCFIFGSDLKLANTQII